MPGVSRKSILLIGDDEGVRRSLQLGLLNRGFEVRAFATGQAAISSSWSTTANVLLADYPLSDSDGISIFEQMRARGWQGTAILFSGALTHDLRARALEAGFDAVLDKPPRMHELLPFLG